MVDDKDVVITDYEKCLLNKEYALLLENKCTQLKNTIYSHNKELQSKNKQINDFDSKLTNLKNELVKYKDKINSKDVQIRKLSSQLESYENLIKNKDSKINDLKFKLDFFISQYDKLNLKYKDKQKEVYILNHDANFYKNECLDTQNKIVSLEKINNDFKKDIWYLKEENIRLSNELNKLKTKNKKIF